MQLSFDGVRWAHSPVVVSVGRFEAGTQVTTHFTALKTADKLADNDPAEMLNGETQWQKTNRTTYIRAANYLYRAFRLGYVALMHDGTRQYFSADSLYCQGSNETTADVTLTVPEGTSQLWLIVSPAPRTYVQHKWTESITNAEQWPYRFELEGTDLSPKATVYTAPTIDGRQVSDVTLTYDVYFPATTGGDYSGTSLTVSGQAAAMLGTALQMQPADIASKMVAYAAAGPAVGKMMFYPCNPKTGVRVNRGSTANGYGHWFNASGAVTEYASGYVYSEFTPSSLTFNFGPYPGKGKNGSDYTVSQALRYKKSTTEEATARFVFNIHLTADKRSAELSAISYNDPTTGIGCAPRLVNDAEMNSERLYDLQGRQVTALAHHGLYIVNGKKIVR